MKFAGNGHFFAGESEGWKANSLFDVHITPKILITRPSHTVSSSLEKYLSTLTKE